MNTHIFRLPSRTSTLRMPSAASLQFLAVGCLLAAVVATFGISVSNTGSSTAHQSTSSIAHATGNGASSVLPEVASPAADAVNATTNTPMWASEIMDSHESVQSLAALAKTKHARDEHADKNSAVSAPSGLALLN